jgi:aspartyl-tRNA(Asn)/glutamyl-tRNA(Gln) amidotransferase subunit B
MPGVLPVINRQAIEYTIMTALALNCKIAEHTRFDRKNYPYPDLMKGYQISQYNAPIGSGGYLNLEVDGVRKKAGIIRVHLEEDVAKLVHHAEPGGRSYSLVDVNRSGVPLMEIVGEPDLRSPEEARQYLIQLRSILRYLGVSTGNMEEGSFRCDANISIRPEGGQDARAKVEVKNMNSFKAVYLALEYEAGRQRKLAAEGKRLVQETRGWVEDKGKTVVQRSKEYAHDYRYFPEPDLPPLVLSREWVEAIKAKLPEMPEARRKRFIDEYQLPPYDADLLTDSKDIADYEEDIVAAATRTPANLPKAEAAKVGSNWLLGEVRRIMNTKSIHIVEFRKQVSPDKLVGLIVLNSAGTVNTATAKSMLEEMYNTGKDPNTLFREGERGQISDAQEIENAVSQVIEANTKAVADYKRGREQSLKFLVGQVMRLTRGRANPGLVNEALRKRLEE